MVDTYKGESPSKRFARAWFWKTALDTYGEDQFCPSKKIFLASRNGGDVAVLKGLGCPFDSMLAVDSNVGAAQEFSSRWPNVAIRVDDVANVVQREGGDAVCVFLDFCGQLSPATLQTVQRVTRAMQANAMLGVAVLKGRESDVGRVDVFAGLNRGQRRRLSAVRRKELRRCGRDRKDPIFYGLHTSSAKQFARVRATLSEADQNRGVWLQRMLHANPLNRPVNLIEEINYQSATAAGGGVPMTIAVFLRSNPKHAKDAWFNIRSMPLFTDDDVRRAVLANELGPHTADLLNIPRSTAAAWKAHNTMGSYQ